MKKILILGASSIQVPLIMKAKSLGLKALVADMDEKAPGATLSDVFFNVSTLDENKILDLAKENEIDAIVTTSDMPVRVVAYVAEKMKLQGPSQSAALICTDKALQRQILETKKFNCPRFKNINSTEDLTDVYHWSFPVIVKPVDSSASRGVQKITSSQALLEAYEFALSNSRSKKVIIEEFIGGKEYSVEVLIQENIIHIIAITEKTTSGHEGRFFVEEMHVVPASIDEQSTILIREEVSRFIKETGLNNSAAHVEVKLNSKGAYIIEAAARLGGDFITSDLVPLATGVDMLRQILCLGLGNKIDVTKTKDEFAGIHFVTPDNFDNAKIHFASIKNELEIRDMHIFNEKKTKELKSSLDRMGHVIASAPSRERLEKLLFF